MKMLVMGEGPTDVGSLDYQTGALHEGPVLVMIGRILGGENSVILLDKSDLKKRGKRYQRSMKGLHGHGQMSFLAKMQSVDDQCDMVVFYRDADREGGRDARKEKVCQDRFEEVRADILTGFQRARRPEVFDLAVVPVKMIESWLMASPKAFAATFGDSRTKLAKSLFPNCPELEWGDKDDLQSNYPKNQMNRILACFDETASQDCFARLAEHVDFDEMCQKCPISFSVFYQDLQGIKKNLEG